MTVNTEQFIKTDTKKPFAPKVENWLAKRWQLAGLVAVLVLAHRLQVKVD